MRCELVLGCPVPEADRELARAMRDHHVDLRTITPRQWVEIFDHFGPQDTREAIGLITQAAGFRGLLRAANGLTGKQEQHTDNRPRKLQAKKSGRCKICRAAIAIGEAIVWQPEVGAWHERCDRGAK